MQNDCISWMIHLTLIPSPQPQYKATHHFQKFPAVHVHVWWYFFVCV